MIKVLVWNIYALCYDVILFSIPHRKMFGRVINHLVDNGLVNVVDFGSGTGNLEVIGRKSGINFLCLDFSLAMSRILEFKKLLLNFDARTIQHDIDDLPPRETFGSCDAAVLINVIFASADLAGLIKSVDLTLKKKAAICLVWPKKSFDIMEIVKLHCGEVIKSSPLGYAVLFLQLTLLALPLACLILINVVVLSFFEKGNYRNYTPDEVKDLLIARGFRVVDEESTLADQEYLLIAHRG